jgi:hypothetical protein
VNAKWYAKIASPLVWTVGLNYVTSPLVYFATEVLAYPVRPSGGGAGTLGRHQLPSIGVSHMDRSGGEA